MTEYHATVHRDGKWWTIAVADVDGAVTQARRLTEVDEMARDVVASLLDLDPADVEIVIDGYVFEDGTDLLACLAQVDVARDAAEQAQARYSQLLRDSARALAELQIPMRDIGELMGVSFQRVSQLLGATPVAKKALAGVSARARAS